MDAPLDHPYDNIKPFLLPETMPIPAYCGPAVLVQCRRTSESNAPSRYSPAHSDSQCLVLRRTLRGNRGMNYSTSSAYSPFFFVEEKHESTGMPLLPRTGLPLSGFSSLSRSLRVHSHWTVRPWSPTHSQCPLWEWKCNIWDNAQSLGHLALERKLVQFTHIPLSESTGADFALVPSTLRIIPIHVPSIIKRRLKVCQQPAKARSLCPRAQDQSPPPCIFLFL